MKKNIIFSLFCLFTIISSADAKTQVIKFSQSLRGGNGSNTLIVGTDSADIFSSENLKGQLFTHFIVIDKKTIEYLSSFISKNCNKNFNTTIADGYQVIIRNLKKDDTSKCNLMNTKIVKGYFKDLIIYLKKSKPSYNRNLLIGEMQQISDYATLTKYRN